MVRVIGRGLEKNSLDDADNLSTFRSTKKHSLLKWVFHLGRFNPDSHCQQALANGNHEGLNIQDEEPFSTKSVSSS